MEEYIEILKGIVALPDHMKGTLGDFANKIKILIEEEQRKPLPNNALIGFLCDAARLGYEFIEMNSKGIKIDE